MQGRPALYRSHAARRRTPAALPTGWHSHRRRQGLIDDSKALRDWLAERGTTAVIPPRKNRKVQYHYDKTVYRQRNIIERPLVCAPRCTQPGLFCRLKDWRRIATRFDRNIKNFIAAIALAAAVIWWL